MLKLRGWSTTDVEVALGAPSNTHDDRNWSPRLFWRAFKTGGRSTYNRDDSSEVGRTASIIIPIKGKLRDRVRLRVESSYAKQWGP